MSVMTCGCHTQSVKNSFFFFIYNSGSFYKNSKANAVQFILLFTIYRSFVQFGRQGVHTKVVKDLLYREINKF